MSVPAFSSLELDVKKIISDAKRDKTLSRLTVRIIRNKLEVIHRLEPGALSAKEYKHSLKTLVLAQVASQEPLDNDDTPEKIGKALPGGKRGGDTNKIYKSAEFVECSDLEDLSQHKPILSRNSNKLKSTLKPQSNLHPIKRRKITPHAVESENGQRSLNEENASKSDSEVSSLFGDSFHSKPNNSTLISKKQATKTGGKRQQLKAQSSGNLSKNDATIQKLKSLINACGVRKPWAKILQDCPNAGHQIAKLREILASLGMTGRLSMEQAKEIKMKRELAQELEDVQSFEQSMVNRNSKCRAMSVSESRDLNAVNSDDGQQPPKRKSKTLKCIEAFLEDQSEED